MTKRKVAVPSPVAPSALLGDIRALIEAARKRAASAVNSELTMLYWRIGQRIRTQVLDGRRGAYGKEVLPTLAEQLVKVSRIGVMAPGMIAVMAPAETG
ncbi:DUF1016 N-terminal domain-containing protein [Burkholderia stagnalis]|uniref:DUF1016 N-terminal domain-containing protein n=1 Tax=Burkholderia stagnalis TaxID=1503054 RepID=UPI00406480BF